MAARSTLPGLAVLLVAGLVPAQEAPASRPATTATIEGRVLLDEGIACGPGFEIKLVVRVGDDRWRSYDLELDDAGRFYRQGIEAGRGTIRIEAAGWFRREIEDLSLQADETCRVDPIDLRGRLYALRFTVLDAETRAPVAHARVCGSLVGPLFGATDLDGRFAMIAGEKQITLGFWSRPHGGCPHEAVRDGVEVALHRWIRIRVHLSEQIQLPERSVDSYDQAGILVAATKEALDRSHLDSSIRDVPGLAVVGTKRTVELFVQESGLHEVCLTRTGFNFKRQRYLERLLGPFPVKIAEGQREAEVTLTCDPLTAIKIRMGLRKAGLR